MQKALVSLGSGLLFAIALSCTASAADTGPASVGISNLTDSGFTVTWWTSGVETGQVQLVQGTLYDDARGPGYAGVNHFVTVDDLQAGTDYAFDIVSGGERDHHAGAHRQVTTGDALPPREPDFIGGRLRNADGSPTGDVIVYVMMERLQQSVVSGLQSTLVTAGQDEFHIDLGRARLATDPDTYFEYSVQGDRYLNNGLSILALGPERSGVVTLDLSDTRLRAQEAGEMLVVNLTRAGETAVAATPSSTNLPTVNAPPTPTKSRHTCPRGR